MDDLEMYAKRSKEEKRKQETRGETREIIASRKQQGVCTGRAKGRARERR